MYAALPAALRPTAWKRGRRHHAQERGIQDRKTWLAMGTSLSGTFIPGKDTKARDEQTDS